MPYARYRILDRDQIRDHHGLTPPERRAMLAAQGGQCWLCDEPLTADAAQVDHDHRYGCHPRAGSCIRCRRGLAHPACNAIAGLAGDDPDRLARIAANLGYGFSPAALRWSISPREVAG